MFSQSDTSKTKITGYTCIGLSVTNSDDFQSSSYPSIEGGIVYKDLSIGLVCGRGNLLGMGNSNDALGNYYYEVKTSAYCPIGILTGNILFGWGKYFTNHSFIEFGCGISFSKGKICYGINYSNWDNINYITPNITFSF